MPRYLAVFFIAALLFTSASLAQTSPSTDQDTSASPPSPRSIFDEPRDGSGLLLTARATYENCSTYRAQGAVRVIKYEETEGGGGFLFQTEKGPARTKRVKLFTTAYAKTPFALRHEIVSMGLGRSFTSVEYWGPQRHVVDHYSSSSLPLTSEALADSVAENERLLVDFNPVPDWLLHSNPGLQPIAPPAAGWLDGAPQLPNTAWWIGQEQLAGVSTDIVTWKNAEGEQVALWLTRSPVAVVKLMAEFKEGTDYQSVTTLIQPEFDQTVGQSLLAINRPRPAFFDTDPGTIAFSDLGMPPFPDGAAPPASAAGVVRQAPSPSLTEQAPGTPAEPEESTPGMGAAEQEFISGLPGDAPIASPAAQAPDDDGKSLLSADQMKAIVVIEGDHGVGTGFYCNIRGRDFIVTNLHVISGHSRLNIRTVDGEPVEAGEVFGAKGHDIALISVGKPKGELAAAANVSDDTEIGDRVVVPGNKLGGGVVTQVSGRVLGVGPDRVEIDARFVPGNSGSPIINLDTGEVIGVATYVRKDMPQNFAESANMDEEVVEDGAIIRWFGYRIDSVTQWERIDWNAWQRQHDVVTRFNEDSLAIYYYLANRREFYDNPTMRTLFEDFVEKMSIEDRQSAYYERETKLYIQRIINFARRELDEIKRMSFYDYFCTTAGPDQNVTENIRYRELIIDHLEGLGARWRVLANRVRR